MTHHQLQDLSGFLLIDKPAGISSGAVLGYLKRLGLKKLGHSGTLDPMASGLLVVLVGKATKLQDLTLNQDKSYSGLIQLGYETDTDDQTGQVTWKADEPAFIGEDSWSDLEQKLQSQFLGDLRQRPPSYSAIKINGRRSYKLARKGRILEIPERLIRIHESSFRFVERDIVQYFLRVSKGTYIRAIARDLGRFIETGACLKSIRRLSAGDLSVEQALSLDKLLTHEDAISNLHPVEQLLRGLPSIELPLENVRRLQQGIQSELKSLRVGVECGQGSIAVIRTEGRPAGLMEFAAEGWKIRAML